MQNNLTRLVFVIFENNEHLSTQSDKIIFENTEAFSGESGKHLVTGLRFSSLFQPRTLL